MKCELCRRDQTLRNSHIIPEWVYKDLYDDKHRINVLSTDARRPKLFAQKGITEKMLCDDCEQKFSRYENYARKLIKGGVGVNVIGSDRGVLISGIDYTKLKLFQMSVLWRAGVSKHQMFSRVKLGVHKERLRRMLLRDHPGKQTDYPCLIFGLSGSKAIPNLIDQPTLTRVQDRKCYRFIFSSFVWVFFVDCKKTSQLLKKHILSKNGHFVLWIKPFDDLDYLKEFAMELNRLGRLQPV